MRCTQRKLGFAAGSGTGALQALLAFFVGLNNRDSDGRIITDPSSKSFKFVLLNAAYQFSKVCNRSKVHRIPGLGSKQPSLRNWAVNGA